MGLGSWLSKVAHGVQNAVDDMRYQRDFGPHYKERFAAEQAYLDRMADEQAQKQEEMRRRQEAADARQAAADKRAQEDQDRQAMVFGASQLQKMAVPQADGRILLPGDPVSLGLARTPEEGERIATLARRGAEADHADAAAKAAKAVADKLEADQTFKQHAIFSDNLGRARERDKPKPTPKEATRDELKLHFLRLAKGYVSAAQGTQGLEAKPQTPDEIATATRTLAAKLAADEGKPDLFPSAAPAAATAGGSPPQGPGSGPKVGDAKTFKNGRVGKWDGKGWVPI